MGKRRRWQTSLTQLYQLIFIFYDKEYQEFYFSGEISLKWWRESKSEANPPTKGWR